MKQLRWIIILAAAAVVLAGVFIAVDRLTKKKEEAIQAGAPKQLFQIDSTKITRIDVDNKDSGTFEFDWNKDAATWELIGDDQFNLNSYAVSAICNYICDLQSVKTVAFDCQDTGVYGFDEPVTLKVYTTDTGEEHPYVLYVGDNTPTYDAYYAMVEGSNDVYTIDYTSGSIFCVARNTLKNMYLFDTFSTLVMHYKATVGDEVKMEVSRDSDYVWSMQQPAPFAVGKGALDNLMDVIVRVTVDSYVEDNPESLAKYGLDKPWAKLLLEGNAGNQENTPMKKEIWFGNNISDKSDETLMYGYFSDTKEVFQIKRTDVSFLNSDVLNYISPRCLNVSIEDLESVEINMGDVYDLHSTIYTDYANETYSFDDKKVSELEDESAMTALTTLYRRISTLEVTGIDLDAKPDGDPDITIVYKFKDGHTSTLEFIRAADNNFYFMLDGKYQQKTVRLKKFTGEGGISQEYESFRIALDKAEKNQ